MAVPRDLEFYNGETWIINYQLNDGDDTDLDLTGGTISWKLTNANGTNLMTRTIGDGITLTEPTTGLCQLTVTPAMQTTAGVAANNVYGWELRAVLTTGLITVQADGSLHVKASLH
jgi:hypothetical protein